MPAASHSPPQCSHVFAFQPQWKSFGRLTACEMAPPYGDGVLPIAVSPPCLLLGRGGWGIANCSIATLHLVGEGRWGIANYSITTLHLVGEGKSQSRLLLGRGA